MKMKKITAFLMAFLTAFALWAEGPALSETAENGLPGRNAALDAAFAAGIPLRLVPEELPGRPGAGWAPISLSPDGKSVLWRFSKGLIQAADEIRKGLTLTRNGTEIPLMLNTAKGIGDPHENSKQILRLLTALPSAEGLSWSADGRWISLSCMKAAFSGGGRPFDVPVVDADTGEMWLADSLFFRMTNDVSGMVYLSRIDRSGQYLYYLLILRNRSEAETRLCFCRCPAEGGEREVLCDMVYDGGSDYGINDPAFLFEAADGSWLLAGRDRNMFSSDSARLALIRFFPSGEGWSREVIPSAIPAGVFNYDYVSWSAASGYGLAVLSTSVAGAKSYIGPLTAGSTDENLDEKLLLSLRYVNLVRLLPGNGGGYDVWCLRKTGDEPGDVEMVPADDFLWSVKINAGDVNEREEPAAAEWLAANGQEGDVLFPAGYDDAAFRKDLDGEGRIFTTCAAVSPDGYYALVNAGSGKEYRLYLVSLETMEVLPVEAPEGVAGRHLGNNTFGKGFGPAVIWNQDGTLLIALEGTGGQTAAFRLETGE